MFLAGIPNQRVHLSRKKSIRKTKYRFKFNFELTYILLLLLRDILKHKINEFISQSQNQIKIRKYLFKFSTAEVESISHLPNTEIYTSRVPPPPQATLQGSLYQPSDTIPLPPSIIFR